MALSAGVVTIWGFPEGSVVKNPTFDAGDTGHVGWIPGGEDLLEKKMETLFSILAWEIP